MSWTSQGWVLFTSNSCLRLLMLLCYNQSSTDPWGSLQLPYSSKFSWCNIFMYFTINLEIMKNFVHEIIWTHVTRWIYSALAEKWAGQHWIMKMDHKIFIIYFNTNLERFMNFWTTKIWNIWYLLLKQCIWKCTNKGFAQGV